MPLPLSTALPDAGTDAVECERVAPKENASFVAPEGNLETLEQLSSINWAKPLQQVQLPTSIPD